MGGFEGVSMTNNVPVAVGPQVSTPEGRTGFDTEIADGSMVKSAGHGIVEDIAQEGDVSTKLFDSAKDEGSDVALEKFVNGDFDEEAFEQFEKESAVKDPVSADESEIEANDLQNSDVHANETNPYLEEINSLESTVSDLIERNNELAGKLEKSEVRVDIALKTVEELVEIIKRILAEKEMSEEEKMGFLELIFAIMAKLMQAMFVPEKSDGVAQGVSGESQKERDKKIFEMFGRVEKKAA